MNLLINIGHPAHVHFFKNIIPKLEKKGWKVKILARDKEITLRLLEIYGLEYVCISGYYDSILGKIFDLLKTDFSVLKIAKKFNPDVLIGIGDHYVAHAARWRYKRASPCPTAGSLLVRRCYS